MELIQSYHLTSKTLLNLNATVEETDLSLFSMHVLLPWEKRSAHHQSSVFEFIGYWIAAHPAQCSYNAAGANSQWASSVFSITPADWSVDMELTLDSKKLAGLSCLTKRNCSEELFLDAPCQCSDQSSRQFTVSAQTSAHSWWTYLCSPQIIKHPPMHQQYIYQD